MQHVAIGRHVNFCAGGAEYPVALNSRVSAIDK